jgi:hypothetical protein
MEALAVLAPLVSYSVLAVNSSHSADRLLAEILADDSKLVVLNINGDQECSFANDDGELHHAVANLPRSGRMAVGYSDGILRGRDLALFLRCSMAFVGASACMSSGVGRPGSAAVYAAAAGHIGTVATEKLLFAAKEASVAEAVSSCLVFPVSNLDEAVKFSQARYPTLSHVAKANLVTWPFSIDAAKALIDETNDAIMDRH